MKQISLFLILAIVILCSCGGSKTKHVITETGRTTLAGEEFSGYSVDNEYSISIPSFLSDRNNDPDRYSLSYNHADIEDLDNIGFWAVFVEGDSRETYEARRKEEGNLDKYPFTLKGYYDIGIDKGDKSQPLQLIGSVQEANINNMPALVQSYKASIDMKLAKAEMYGFLVYLQADNGKIYRLNICYPIDEGDGENIPEWVIEVCNSFNSHK